MTAVTALAVGTAAWAAGGYEVKWAGAMRRVMHERDFSAHADTADLPRTGDVWALGPAEGLRAEITVLGGVPHTARVGKGGWVEVGRDRPRAAFLVWSRVPAWRAPVPVPAGAGASQADLARFIAREAERARIDLTKPFPFRVEGTARSLDYHVVRDGGGHAPFTLRGGRVRVLGFRSDRHHGVFVHRGTDVHLHFATADGKASGHIDALTLAPGARLFLPRP